jgi:hypothetical protein
MRPPTPPTPFTSPDPNTARAPPSPPSLRLRSIDGAPLCVHCPALPLLRLKLLLPLAQHHNSGTSNSRQFSIDALETAAVPTAAAVKCTTKTSMKTNEFYVERSPHPPPLPLPPPSLKCPTFHNFTKTERGGERGWGGAVVSRNEGGVGGEEEERERDREAA